MQTIVRVNGLGNAWPVFIGSKHPFYEPTSTNLANASYSLIAFEGPDYLNGDLRWEILVDAGNHTAPFIIQRENRIPEAIVLTHGHTDHTLGIDWVAQSYFYKHGKKKKYPLYASGMVWEIVRQSYPQLNHVIEFTELFPGMETQIKEIEDLVVTAYPVFHGESARGASMLFFEYKSVSRVLFTGDMLCPMLRKKDYRKISTASMMYIDTNNRFPDPSSNHTSVVRNAPGTKEDSPLLQTWLKIARLSHFLSMHGRSKLMPEVHDYFDEFLSDWKSVSELPLCTLDFMKTSGIRKVNLVHYAGLADERNYGEAVLKPLELENWANALPNFRPLTGAEFRVPEVGSVQNF